MPQVCGDSIGPSHERVGWSLLDRWIPHPNVLHVDGFHLEQIHEQVPATSLAFRPTGSRP